MQTGNAFRPLLGEFYYESGFHCACWAEGHGCQNQSWSELDTTAVSDDIEGIRRIEWMFLAVKRSRAGK